MNTPEKSVPSQKRHAVGSPRSAVLNRHTDWAPEPWAPTLASTYQWSSGPRTMFDGEKGQDKARPDDYLEPKLKAEDPVSLNEYTIIG